MPALLSNAPEMVLGDLNLISYTILPVEPLHDIKGHTINQLQSPHYLDGQAHQALEDVVKPTCTKRKKMESQPHTQVSPELLQLKKNPPTFEFELKARQSSYEAHLESCRDFLLPGPGVWWRKEGTGKNARLINCDGTDDPDEHPEGPKISHCRDTTIFAEHTRIKDIWRTVIDSKIELPCSNIR